MAQSDMILGRRDTASRFCDMKTFTVSAYDSPAGGNLRYTLSNQNPDLCKPSVRYRIRVIPKQPPKQYPVLAALGEIRRAKDDDWWHVCTSHGVSVESGLPISLWRWYGDPLDVIEARARCIQIEKELAK